MTSPRKRITLSRTFRATVDEVWELWTTPDGIESWWGPEGFEVEVKRLELREGGVLEYEMTAVAEGPRAFMAKAGMPLTTSHVLTFTEVTPGRRLAYRQLADFVPGVEPYPIDTLVELHAGADGVVRMDLTFDVMHDERWTELAVAGHESELGKLARRLTRLE